MMYTQSRKRKWVSPFSSFLSDSFLLFSLHFPFHLNCQSNCKRKKTTHSEDPNSGASSLSTLPHGGDFEGGGEQREGNNYEVFLSFNEKDTGKGFTSYLDNRLSNAGIQVFINKRELPTGEPFGPELIRAITRSKISIPIISENYAFSKWCLRELVHMLKCRRNAGQKVLPIFYKVKCSRVRSLKGRLRDEFIARKVKVDGIDFKEWEGALEEVCKLEALQSEEIDNGHEGTLVEVVFRKVMLELKRHFQLNLPKQLVGIDDRVEQIVRSIDAGVNGMRIIGIHGMGGIGKTTLAKELYNRLSSRFDCHSFVEDIRETSRRMGIPYVQNKLISAVIGDFNDVSNVDEGISIIKSLVKNKNVLVLLDDMDDDTHLNALVGDRSWFSAGSVIIITTRNKDILDKVESSPMYQVNELPLDQSLILFSRHAFRKDSPPSDCEGISCDIVSTTGGLPLALEVIGAFLCGKKMKVWQSTSEKLKEIPNKRVMERLKISYDGLDTEDQKIFLDIACFFVGSSQQIPTYMWDACGFFPVKGIEVLSLMSLIKIDEDGEILMHDQLRDLGREIVRLENQKELQKRSRLWKYEEAVNVLDRNKGTSEIEALSLDKLGWERRFEGEQFQELTNLRFLQVKGAIFTGDFQNLLPQLNWLQWEHCPRDFTATHFQPQKLVILDLSRSEISENWGGWDQLKVATELKVLDLTDCQFLRRTPDLSAFKSLEILNLTDCSNLEEIDPSIREIKTLISLNVERCYKLKELPAGVDRMEELREPILTCARVQEIPISRGYLMKLETLRASYCLSLTCLPNSIGHLASLTLLNLSNCYMLAKLPDSIGSLVSLQHLTLAGCNSLREIPYSIGKLTSLTKLCLSATMIEELPESIGFLKDLETVVARHCKSLAHIPSSIGGLASLSALDLEGCHKLCQLPDSIGKLTSLTELDLNSTAIVELPESIGNMQNLKMLDISGTPAIKLLSDSGIMVELQELRANLEGLASGTDKLVLPNKLDLDKKRSELRSRLLALVHLKRPRIPPAHNSATNYQTAGSEHILKISRPFGISDEPPTIAAFGSGNATVGESLGDRGAPVAAMVGMNSGSMADVKPRIANESGDKSQIRKLTEINEPWQCRSIRLPDDTTAVRVSRLIYTNSFHAILALTSNGVHKLWKWQSDQNLTGGATTSAVPQLWRPGGNLLINDKSNTNPEETVPCFALGRNDGYLISTSGGKISVFNIMTSQTKTTFMPQEPASTLLATDPQDNNIITIGMEDNSIQIYSGQVDEVQTKLKGRQRIIKGFTFSTVLNVLVSSGADSQIMTTFMPRPAAATFLALHPQDPRIIAIGMDDSSILIYDAGLDEVETSLKGHQKKITGLAFSNVLNVLVSTGADSQLCVWSTDGWEKQASRFLQMPTGRVASPLADTRVQFHMDQIHLLVVHETQIAIYEAPKLECLQQWHPREASGPITDATYSCNGQSIYVSFEDGSIGVLTASALGLRCRINPAAYIPPNPSLRVYPLVIAAHPYEANQFALGLTDGSVYVLEPLESEADWGTSPPIENGAGPSTSSGATCPDQPHLSTAGGAAGLT